MNNGLLIFLSLTGFLALYWVLFGQWHHNKMMREAEKKAEETQEKK